MIIYFRKTSLFTVFISILLFISSCNYINNVKLLTGGSLDRTDFVETIPFEYKKDLIIVDLKINEEGEKRQFIFDTGAFESKIEIGLAEELELPVKATKTNSTAQGITQTIDVTRIENMKLGQTNFSNISAGKLEYDSGSASQCIAPHGIIGANLIKLAHWKIDYEKQEVTFSDNVLETSEDAAILDFDRPLLSGTPEIEVTIAGKNVSGVLFDVGFNGGLILPSRFSSSFTSTVEQQYYDRSTSGIFGTNTDTLIAKQLDVSIAGHEMNIPVEFSSIGKALLGNDILEHFEVAIDYNKKQISLSPQSDIKVDSPYLFIPGVLNDSLWVVNRTTETLPFMLGDTLLTVNNQRPADLFSSFCDYFLNINKIMAADSLLVTPRNGSAITIYSEN